MSRMGSGRDGEENGKLGEGGEKDGSVAEKDWEWENRAYR